MTLIENISSIKEDFMEMLNMIVEKYVKNKNSIDDISVSLNLEKRIDWKHFEEKIEIMQDIYSLPDSSNFLAVCFYRSGDYHSDYFYEIPVFKIVKKLPLVEIISYKEKSDSESVALAENFSEKYVKGNEDKLIQVYNSNGWIKDGKTSYWDVIYDLNGVLLKETLIGDENWTDLTIYRIVEKEKVIAEQEYIPV